VDVVLHPADFNGLHFILPGDATEKRPEPFAEFKRDERVAFLGAEYAMEIGTNVGHGIHSAVPTGLLQYGTYPGVETPGYFQDVPLGQDHVKSPLWVKLAVELFRRNIDDSPALELTLRPSLFSEFTGQPKVKERPEIAVTAAKNGRDRQSSPSGAAGSVPCSAVTVSDKLHGDVRR